MGVAVERTPKIESVNLTGGRLIREAKVIVLLLLIPMKENVFLPFPLRVFLNFPSFSICD